MSVCLDSWAILAWLDGEEPALSRVNAVIASRPVVSWVNLVEVYYRIERDHGREAADDTLRALRRKLSPDLPGNSQNDRSCALESAFTNRAGRLFRGGDSHRTRPRPPHR